MLTEFEGFDTEGFFASGSEAVAVDFSVILFVPRARISEGALLVGPGASISIGSISSSDTPSNRTELLIYSRTFGLP